MNLPFLVLCVLFCYFSGYGQMVWQKDFEVVKTNIISMQYLQKTNNVRMIGIEGEKVYSYAFGTEKNITSNTIFQKELPFSPNIIHALDTKNYIITKDEKRGLTYAKVDAKGNVFWQKALPTLANIKALCATESGGFLMVGTQKGQMYAVRIDAKGRVIWQETFGGSGEILDVVPTKDGSFILVGYVDLFQSGETDYFITKLDATGKNIWEKVLGNPEYLNEKATLVAITPKEQILIVGHRNDHLWMLQMSPDKQIITWETEIKKENIQLQPISILTLKNGSVFIASQAILANKSHYLSMLKLNTELMASSNDWVARFSLTPLSGRDQRQLNVRYKPINKYYRVTSNLKGVATLQLFGKHKKGYSVYVLGIHRNGTIGIIAEPQLKPIRESMTASIDLEVYQYLIVLVSDAPCNIQKIKDELTNEKRVISALPTVIGSRLIADENVYYKSDELIAYAQLGYQNIVSFFIQLK